MLNGHLMALRAVPRFRDLHFRLIIECNLEQGTLLCDKALEKISDVSIVCSTNHTYGVFTAPGMKHTYFNRIKRFLGRGALAFYETVVSANPFQSSISRNELSRVNMNKLQNQFRTFRHIYGRGTFTGRKTSYFTGHADHENKYTSRMTDDIVMAIGFGVHFTVMLCCDPPCAKLRSRINRFY